MIVFFLFFFLGFFLDRGREGGNFVGTWKFAGLGHGTAARERLEM